MSTKLMNATTFQNTLEFDLSIEFDERIKNLHGSNIFFHKIISNIEKRIRENDFIKLSAKKYQDFLNYKFKQILASGECFVLYRIAGHLYLNRKIKDNWETAKFY